MRTGRTTIGRGVAGAAMLFVAACGVPEKRQAAGVPAPMTDTRQLVRLLAPALDDRAIAALPEVAIPASGAPLAPAVAATPFANTAATLDDAARARDCLTAAVYYEARSEPADGQRAVAQVVLNRVRDRAFPHSVCGVVYQGVGSGKGCQFSFACDGSMDRQREPGAWGRAGQIAAAALNGDVMAAVGNATFYHAGYVLPWWASSLTRLGSVGSHIFYRWPGALERALGMRASYAGVEPGMPAARAETAGVAIVRGGDFGVTVHRGGGEAADGAFGESRPSAPAARFATSSGVRIHRGEEGPIVADGV